MTKRGILSLKKPSIKVKPLQFEATQSSGNVSALLTMPKDARWLLVLAHGAGAGMRHRFMDHISEVLASEGIGSFRYQFPYMEGGSRRPDPKPVLYATVRSAISTAAKLASGLPLLAGGKSMGGRMTSMASVEGPLDGVTGIVFVGFPLHPAGQPSTERAAHLQKDPPHAVSARDKRHARGPDAAQTRLHDFGQAGHASYH